MTKLIMVIMVTFLFFLDKINTPENQALNSPTKLWKFALSRSLLRDQYSIAMEFYYNSEIYLMQQPPTSTTDVLKSDLSLYDLPPLPEENTKNSLSGKNITRYRVWKVPPSRFFNLTFSSNIGNPLILVVSIKKILNKVVCYPLDIDSESFNSPNFAPHMLRGFGRELFVKLGYRF
ncbi:MAG: hypothetical protein H7A23_17765 [Leptospiraceae bacterium]|nr:hypothetical protein [Leptospiraceae bacterium]